MNTRSHRMRAVAPAMLLALLASTVASLHGSSAAPPSEQARRTTTHSCEKITLELCVLGDDMAMLDHALNEKLMVMHAATPGHRLDALESVVEELATQRREIWDKMKYTHQNVLIHLMQHIQCGDDVQACPLMSFMQNRALSGTAITTDGECDQP